MQICIYFILLEEYFFAKFKNGKYSWISISAIVVYMIFNIIEAVNNYNPIAMSKSLFSIIMIKVIAFGILGNVYRKEITVGIYIR